MGDLLRTALRFGAAGVVNSALGWGLILLLSMLGAEPTAANAAGYGTGVAVAFFLHRRLFAGRRTRAETVRYALSVLLAFGLNQAVLRATLTWGPHTPAQVLAQGAGVVAYALTLFVLSRWWVFRPGCADISRAQPSSLVRASS